MEDFLLLEIPTFKPEYEKSKKLGYSNAEEKSNLRDILANSTGGYCMYCYSRVRVDGKLSANLEHAIEKSNSKKLIKCIPDIGLSCSTCNQTFKRIDEKKRKLSENAVSKFEKMSRCSIIKQEQCTVPCKALRELQKDYSSLPNAEIILQPMGVKGIDSGENLRLQYNVLNMEFEPAKGKCTYSDREIQFINAHINRFRLNNPKYRSKQLFDFVRNIIDNDGKIPTYEYNNLVVELFKRKISGKSKEEVLKICKSIFKVAFPKM